MTQGQQILETVSQAVDSGASLPTALRALATESRGRLARTLRSLAVELENGQSLDEVLQDPRLRLGRHTIAGVRAGLVTGRIAAVLSEITEQQRTMSLMRRQLVRTLAYPCVVVSIALGVAVFAMLVVVPPFQDILSDFETPLPPMTAQIVWWSNTGWKLFTAGLVSVAGIFVVFRIFSGAANWRWLLSTIPVFGTPFWWASTAEFARLLKVLIHEEVELDEALDFTADGLSDANMAAFSRHAAEAIRSGRSFASTIVGNIRIPTSIQPIIAWGEQNGCLSEALELIAEIFEGALTLRARWLDAILPAVLFIVVGGIVLVIVFALFVPLTTTLQLLVLA